LAVVEEQEARRSSRGLSQLELVVERIVGGGGDPGVQEVLRFLEED